MAELAPVRVIYNPVPAVAIDPAEGISADIAIERIDCAATPGTHTGISNAGMFSLFESEYHYILTGADSWKAADFAAFLTDAKRSESESSIGLTIVYSNHKTKIIRAVENLNPTISGNIPPIEDKNALSRWIVEAAKKSHVIIEPELSKRVSKRVIDIDDVNRLLNAITIFSGSRVNTIEELEGVQALSEPVVPTAMNMLTYMAQGKGEKALIAAMSLEENPFSTSALMATYFRGAIMGKSFLARDPECRAHIKNLASPERAYSIVANLQADLQFRTPSGMNKEYNRNDYSKDAIVRAVVELTLMDRRNT